MPRRPLPSLTGLRAFEAFARLGSMTAAGGELCITHGAVSRLVRGLDAQLGVKLLQGPKHDLKLTDAGRQLSGALTPALDMIAAGLPGGGGAAEELVVTCYATLAMKWLIPRLPRFVERHPQVRVRILESHAPADFSQGGVQAAIRIEQGPPAAGVRSTPFMAHVHGPVLSASRWAELDGNLQKVLSLPRLHSETFRPAWPAWAERAGVTLPPSVMDREFEHNSYMLEAAAAGMGVAVAPWAFAGLDIEQGRLVAPFGFEPLAARYVYLRPKLSENPAAEAFGAWLQDEGARAPKPPEAIT